MTAVEWQVYGAMQAMFNAKPDFAITIDGYIIVFEVKLTEPFDNRKLRRTYNIAQIWASEVLYKDLGFSSPPSFTVAKLGRSTVNVHVSWEDVLLISQRYYNSNDKSLIAFEKAVSLLIFSNE